jgi:hypothetical protein
MSAEMDALQQEVAETIGVMESAIAFIQGVSTQVRDAAGDRQKSMDLANDLDQKAHALAQAIESNSQPAS